MPGYLGEGGIGRVKGEADAVGVFPFHAGVASDFVYRGADQLSEAAGHAINSIGGQHGRDEQAAVNGKERRCWLESPACPATPRA